MKSRWRSRMYVCRPKKCRMGSTRISTMAKPEKMAPSTKNGANSVECQPGTSAIAKSHDTTLCKDSTSGVDSAAHKPQARRHGGDSRSEPSQPSASIPNTRRRQPVEASRSAARSGTRPTMKNTVLVERYVEIAHTSHTSGDLKLGHR